MCFSTQLEKVDVVAKRFNAGVSSAAFKQLKMLSLEDPKKYKIPDDSKRVFPNYWSYTMVLENGQRMLRPMRYQLLPHFCKEDRYTRINPKTGRKVQVKTFNARVDALEERHAWKKIFGHKHCLVLHKAFFEWIPNPSKNNKVELAAFQSTTAPTLWSAGLWDRWESPDGNEIIDSYAIITIDPVNEILEAGHDRMPAMIQEDYIDSWLNPAEETKSELYEMLHQREPIQYHFNWA